MIHNAGIHVIDRLFMNPNITAVIFAHFQEMRPRYIVLSSTSVDVSLAVKALTGLGDLSLGSCQFAIRGAG
jgi:hypothetical protein